MALRALYERLKLHVLDCTSLVTLGNPFFGAYEKLVLGLENDVFLKTRLVTSCWTYAGMGFVFAGGRDLSRKLFGINKQSPEKKQEIHDAVYAMAYNSVITPLIYLSSGADLKQVLWGTVFAVGTAIPTGIAAGYALDVGRDFAGIEQSPRVPKQLQGLSPCKKKAVYASAVAASICLIGLLYRIPSDSPAVPVQNVTLEQRINSVR